MYCERHNMTVSPHVSTFNVVYRALFPLVYMFSTISFAGNVTVLYMLASVIKSISPFDIPYVIHSAI